MATRKNVQLSPSVLLAEILFFGDEMVCVWFVVCDLLLLFQGFTTVCRRMRACVWYRFGRRVITFERLKCERIHGKGWVT